VRNLVWTLRACLTLTCSALICAQQRTVAITVDDLPYVSAGGSGSPSVAKSVNRRLLSAFRAHHVPVTGFVIQKQVEALGETGTEILRAWMRNGEELGNHTFSHPDINNLPLERIEDEIVRGEAAIGPRAFFRFPFNHTGDTQAKHDAIARFLAQRGYRVAACTIDNSDYVFNAAYIRTGAGKIKREYLEYTSAEIDYYSALNRQVLGYEPPHVMLLHDNRLNAETINEVLTLFERKGYRFTTLEQAETDPAWRTPDTDVTKFGPMWGYRWARERNVKVNGKLEPEPPAWITCAADAACWSRPKHSQ
jgi:peptidoglycan/xylan/chitin deacetylase (PgdA/CDA1 family)